MTGRLIKYELRSSIKLMGVIWAALIVTSFLFSISINFMGNIMRSSSIASTLINLFQGITGMLYIAVFIATAAASVVIIIMRFYKGLLSDEGYLMHTLPVKPWQLITAKGVSALIIVCAIVIVSILSIMILAGTGSFGAIVEFCDLIREMFREEPKVILVAAEFLVLAILSLLKSIYQIYASLSIGQLAGKHRILLSLGAYVGINIVITVLAVLIMMLLDVTGALNGWSSLSLNTVNDMLNAGQAVLGFFAAVTVIQLAAFHVITERILSLRLNLQ